MSDYRKYVATTEVEARQLDEDESVVTNAGVQQANKGDYVVRHSDGAVEIVTGDEFGNGYRAAGGTSSSTSSSSKADDSKAS